MCGMWVWRMWMNWRGVNYELDVKRGIEWIKGVRELFEIVGGGIGIVVKYGISVVEIWI